MGRVGFFLILIAIGLCSAKWFRINSTCFLGHEKYADAKVAIILCKMKGAILHSIKNEAELKDLKKFLNKNIYWVSATKTPSGFKWSDGRACCPRNWWAPSKDERDDCVGVFDGMVYDFSCTESLSPLCSKPADRRWRLVKSEEYNWKELCGVEIMSNCDGRSCEDVCDSLQGCDQIAKISNSCIIIKNDAPLNKCIVKMRPTVELYERSKSDFYCKQD